MIVYRKAESKDLDRILNLIELGFTVRNNSLVDPQEGWEHRLLFSHLYSQPGYQLGWVYLAEQKGNLAAVVGVFPQQLSFGGNLIPVWAISPVATHPEYRGQELAGKCLNWAMLDLKSQGIPAVFLWGLPGYYPRFGFVPLLPRYKTKITHNQLRGPLSKPRGRFRRCLPTDWEDLSVLYNQGTRKFWLQPERKLEWWKNRTADIGLELAAIKEVPFPEMENFLIWENESGKGAVFNGGPDLSGGPVDNDSSDFFGGAGSSNAAGYLYFQKEKDRQKVYIKESAAIDSKTAKEMATAFITEYLAPDQTLYINGTPEHPLNIAVYQLGGTHINPAPLAGMIKVIDWPEFLKRFLPTLESRLNGDGVDGLMEGSFRFQLNVDPYQICIFRENVLGRMEITLSEDHTLADNKHDARFLTKLFFGLYESEDLIALNQTTSRMLEILFPHRCPFIWDNNYLY